MPVGNTIIAKGQHNVYEEGIVVTAAVTPGKMVQMDTTTDADLDRPRVKLKAAANTVGVRAFAIEDGLIGKTVADDYVVGSLCRYVMPRPGEEAYIFLKAGETVVIGDALAYGGAGVLIKYVPGTSSALVGEAREALANPAVDTRIKVRW